MSMSIQNRRRSRDESENISEQKTPKKSVDRNVKKINDCSHNIHSIGLERLKELKRQFLENENNRFVQNTLCTNSLHNVCENRQFMQSRDNNFSHVLDPKLAVSNQGLSGRCWLFALSNVMRHELIRMLKLPFDFEFSESYLSFYEKMEKCNNVLTYFLDKDKIDVNDRKTSSKLDSIEDGGFWVTCANLVRKYGIIPKVCFKESAHSYETEELNKILGYKVRESCLILTQEPDRNVRMQMKEAMMKDIYSILVKMLGCPPAVDEKIEWSFMLREDLIDKLERENRREETQRFETFQRKQTIHVTPHQFYQKLIIHDLDDYYRFSNDPRNVYGKYYQSFEEDFVVGGERNGYYNLPMDQIIKMCTLSIKNNTPVQFDCDVAKYLHHEEELLDTRCFDYESVFKMNFNGLNKEQRMQVGDSNANHAMILVGINEEHQCHQTCNSKNPEGLGVCNCRGRKVVTKFKIENSWGRVYCHAITDEDKGYYTAGLDWFNNYVYTVVIHKDFVDPKLRYQYNRQKMTPITLPENDMMA
jgi:bleomycin hydrolase